MSSLSAVAFLVVVVDDGGGGVGGSGSGGSISLSMGSQDSFVVVVDDLFCVVHAAETDLDGVSVKDFL